MFSRFFLIFSQICHLNTLLQNNKKRTGKRTKQRNRAQNHWYAKERVYQMANIRENIKSGKVVSYRFTVCLERDANNKQIRRYTTWTPPTGLTPAKMKKAALSAADAWEQQIRTEYQKEKEMGQAYTLPQQRIQNRAGQTACT